MRRGAWGLRGAACGWDALRSSHACVAGPYVDDVVEATKDGLVIVGSDALAEPVCSFLQSDRRDLAVEGPLAQQEHELLTEEGEARHRHRRFVWVQLGLPVEKRSDRHVAQKELVDGRLRARGPPTLVGTGSLSRGAWRMRACTRIRPCSLSTDVHAPARASCRAK